MSSTVPSDLQLYQAIQNAMKGNRLSRRLAAFGVDADDAIHELWILLSKYSRKSEIRNTHAYVNRWAAKLLNRVLDQEAKHHRNRDIREVN